MLRGPVILFVELADLRAGKPFGVLDVVIGEEFALVDLGHQPDHQRGGEGPGLAGDVTRVEHLAADLLDLGRLTGALVEGVEMASVALALATHLPPERTRSRSALRALALGAFALKLAWGFEQVSVVRYGGLALLPLALVALVAYVRGRRSATTY